MARNEKYEDGYDVGDVVCETWGYDQTNVDYYRIVRRTPSMVTVRPMSARRVESAPGFSDMSDHVVPGEDMPAEVSASHLYRNDKVVIDGEPWTYQDRVYGACGLPDTLRFLRYGLGGEEWRSIDVPDGEDPSFTVPVPTYRRKLHRSDGEVRGLSVNGHGWCRKVEADVPQYRSWYA